MKKLSIVILNYNTKELLIKCLDSLEKVKGEENFEVIVSDNGSTDRSVETIQKDFTWAKVLRGEKNEGFAKGNNRARNIVSGMYVLFLNSDTEVYKNTLERSVNYLEENPGVGALTCKTVLPNGSLDKDARRSFPTPWVALTHFSGLDRLLPRSRLFARYWYGFKSPEKISEVDVLQGAFCMVRKSVLDEIGWYDEDYFLDGEDIDLCWKIKEAGWKIIYYPEVSILHIKGATKGKVRSFGKITREERLGYINSGVDSMEIFYRKRLWSRYPFFINLLVVLGIKNLKIIRYLKAFLS